MSEKKGWGSTVLGWFIVQDEGAPPEGAAPAGTSGDADAAVIAAAAAIASESSGIFQRDPPVAAGGSVPFDAVFDAAGVDADERERVVKAQQLLASLPSETPQPVKKQIVEASLNAFGVPIDNIIETGVAEIQALEAYIRKSAADTQALLEESNRRIAQLEEETRKVRAGMEQRIQQQQGVANACNARKLDVQKVLEFFGQEAVARVVHASPRLQEP
ncbi:MAG: hypothetical protein H6Q10_1477 [Acidobacteria bacterium]|nr:hypothetical protein [Acidobacteriota bacterium]